METTQTIKTGERTLVFVTDGTEIVDPVILDDRHDVAQKRQQVHSGGGGDWYTLEMPLAVAINAPALLAEVKSLLTLAQVYRDALKQIPHLAEMMTDKSVRMDSARAVIAKVEGGAA